ILAADALKPWQHQSWIFIRDPDFAAKATRVLDLYARGAAPAWPGAAIATRRRRSDGREEGE
ncbi:hypothetical protein, partial [Micromonospora fulviviridis]